MLFRSRRREKKQVREQERERARTAREKESERARKREKQVDRQLGSPGREQWLHSVSLHHGDTAGGRGGAELTCITGNSQESTNTS